MGDKAIRFGGQEVDGRFRFELSGGALALDFVNTLDERPRGGLERLTSYERLLNWAVQAKLADETRVVSCSNLAQRIPAEADRALGNAIALREAMFDVLKARLTGEIPTGEQMSTINYWIRQAGANRSLAMEGGLFRWQEYADLERTDFMLPAVAMSLAGILVDVQMEGRLRLCASADCEWAFLDRTQRRNRVWCDMSVCGNRAKARRHYERTNGAKQGVPLNSKALRG